MERVAIQVGDFNKWRIRIIGIISITILLALAAIYLTSDYVKNENETLVGNLFGVIVLVIVGICMDSKKVRPLEFLWIEFRENSLTIAKKNRRREIFYADIQNVVHRPIAYNSKDRDDVIGFSVFLQVNRKRYRIDSTLFEGEQRFEDTELYLFYQKLYQHWKNYQLEELKKAVQR